jgi:NAD(P)-dependent dehydrogenase (short-subunit alcohol dehydrogenase family)
MKNKVVIVTGASSGIGLACAQEFAAKGARVVLAARNQQKLEEAVKDIVANGGEAMAVQADVSKEADCQRLVEETIQTYGRLDVLINNAGISMRAILAEMEVEVIKQVMDINFYGAVYCSKYALPYLLESKGSIIGMSSIAGYKGLPGRTGYSASKFAMHGFLESLRLENLEKGLHVLIACPGFTASNIRHTALGKDGQVQGESPREEQQMMQPEEVAEEVYKAYVGKQNSLVLTTNGKLTVLLNKFFPKWVDKLVFQHMKKEPNSPF